MSFIDNPVIAGLGEQLGMGDMFASMRNAAMTSDGPSMNPLTQGAAKSAPNVPEYKNRPYIPKNEAPTGGGVRPGQGGGNPITPGAMDPSTLQSPQVQQLLGMYGVRPPTTPPDPNLFIHNPTAHPVIGGMLEGALGALANAHPGQNFLQSFTGGLRGVQEADAERGARYNAQTMAPIQQALAIQQLQHGVDEHNTAQSTMGYHASLIQDAQNRQKALQDEQTNRILATPPRPNPDGTQDIMTVDPVTGAPKWVTDASHGNSELAQQNAYFNNSHAALLKKYGTDAAIPPSELTAVRGNWEKQLSLSKGANQVVVQQMRDATAERDHDTPSASSSSRGGKPGALSQVDKARLADHDKQITLANQELQKAQDMSKPQVMADGSMLVGAKARSVRIQQLQGLIQQHQAAKDAILGNGPAPKAALPTTFSPGNPFAKK